MKNGVKGKKKRHFGLQNKYLDTFGVPWGKCIKRALFTNVLFPPGYWFEDSVIHHIILPRAKKIVWCKSIVYYYRTNSRGVTSQSKGRLASIDSLWITMSLAKDHSDLGLPVDYNYFAYLLRMARVTYWRVNELSGEIRKLVFYIYKEFIVQLYNAQKRHIEIPLYKLDQRNIFAIFSDGTFQMYDEYFQKT